MSSLGKLTTPIYITSAKIALLGDSNEAKKWLGLKIIGGTFESEQHQNFWALDSLDDTNDDTLRKFILWYPALVAQETYLRSMHAPFLDDIDLALIILNLGNPEVVASADYWLKQCNKKKHPILIIALIKDYLYIPKYIEQALESLCLRENISIKSFIKIDSDKDIKGLLQLIPQEIDWTSKPTITLTDFNEVKACILRLKNDTNRKLMLVSFNELHKEISNEQMSDIDLEKGVCLLQKHGDVMILSLPSGQKEILLHPQKLIELATDYIIYAGEESGVLDEENVLGNKYNFKSLKNLENESKKLLIAVNEIFKKREICFSLAHDYQKFLIFPSLRRPFSGYRETYDDKEFDEGNTYIIKGEVKNVYPSLIALLGHARNLKSIYITPGMMQYRTSEGAFCRFKLVEENGEESKLELYYGKRMEEFDRARFWGLIEQILSKLPNVYVEKYPPIFCPKCGRRQMHDTIIQRVMKERESFLYCYGCEDESTKISLSSLPEYLTKESAFVMMRNAFDRVWEHVRKQESDLLQNKKPDCFVSYTWESAEIRQWVSGLVGDLKKAYVEVVHDERDNSAGGSSVEVFMRKIQACKFVVVIGTPSYLQRSKETGTPLFREVEKIKDRLEIKGKVEGAIIPLIREGNKETAIFEGIRDAVNLDFTHLGKYHHGKYFVILFDLILDLYQIRHKHEEKRKYLYETMCHLFPDLKDTNRSKQS